MHYSHSVLGWVYLCPVCTVLLSLEHVIYTGAWWRRQSGSIRADMWVQEMNHVFWEIENWMIFGVMLSSAFLFLYAFWCFCQSLEMSNKFTSYIRSGVHGYMHADLEVYRSIISTEWPLVIMLINTHKNICNVTKLIASINSSPTNCVCLNWCHVRK